jgi:hypothetical protein
MRAVRALLMAVIPIAGMTLLLADPADAARRTSRSSVRAHAPVDLHNGPSNSSRVVGRVHSHAPIAVACKAAGQLIKGTQRTTTQWDRLTNGGWLSDAFVDWSISRRRVPICHGKRHPETVPRTHAEFMARAWPLAVANMHQSRVPASVTLAQAILESGWGRSGLAARDHNYFGMKCFGGPGPVAIGCRSYRTTECDRRHCIRIMDSFRVYRTVADSFRDHSRLLSTSPRYRKAMRYAKHFPNRFATELQRAGYATSPTYAKNLIAVMKAYKLYKYDKR